MHHAIFRISDIAATVAAAKAAVPRRGHRVVGRPRLTIRQRGEQPASCRESVR
jgi:hypothetical protein